jgi:hypothetical protein
MGKRMIYDDEEKTCYVDYGEVEICNSGDEQRVGKSRGGGR